MLHQVGSVEALEQWIADTPLLLVDFWAPWCAPCRAMLPNLEALAKHSDQLNIVTVNADDCPEILEHFGVRGLPNMRLWQNGILVARSSETYSLSEFQQWLAPYLVDEAAELVALAHSASNDAQQLAYLRRAVVRNPEDIHAQEELFSALLKQSHCEVEWQELSQRLQCLSAEQLRSPVLSRVYSTFAFQQKFEEQPTVLKPAYQWALQANYSEALQTLQRVQSTQPEWADAATALMIQILDLIPDRRAAHQLRRQFLTK